MANATPQPVPAASSSVIFRRRDKRRHLSSTALDLRDPFEYVSLAIRFDESRPESEVFLQANLEDGRLYDNTLPFAQALELLKRKTAPPRLLPRKRTSPKSSVVVGQGPTSSKPPQLPPVALTPIILSGLLAAIKDEQHDASKEKPSTTEKGKDIASELVFYCQAMRRAALNRVRTRKRRYQIQRIVLPVGSIAVLLFLFLQNLYNVRNLLVRLDYVGSCDEQGVYQHTCRLAEATLFTRSRSVLREDPIIDSPPFSLHTIVKHNLVALHELLPGRRRKQADDSRHGTTATEDSEQIVSPVVTSKINQLVLDNLEEFLPPPSKHERRILDVGCGAGGTAYALLPFITAERKRTGQNKKNKKPIYRGITISAAEASMARLLMTSHDGVGDDDMDDFIFDQLSYDAPLPLAAYSAAVAIESLAYSQRAAGSVSNIVQSLQPGGILIVVDDVIVDTNLRRKRKGEPSDDPRPSLLSHVEWARAFADAGCNFLKAQDLSLEYEVAVDASLNPGRDWFPFSLAASWIQKTGSHPVARRVVELYEDRAKAAKAWTARDVAYQDTFGYHLYACRKA